MPQFPQPAAAGLQISHRDGDKGLLFPDEIFLPRHPLPDTGAEGTWEEKLNMLYNSLLDWNLFPPIFGAFSRNMDILPVQEAPLQTSL